MLYIWHEVTTFQQYRAHWCNVFFVPEAAFQLCPFSPVTWTWNLPWCSPSPLLFALSLTLSPLPYCQTGWNLKKCMAVSRAPRCFSKANKQSASLLGGCSEQSSIWWAEDILPCGPPLKLWLREADIVNFLFWAFTRTRSLRSSHTSGPRHTREQSKGFSYEITFVFPTFNNHRVSDCDRWTILWSWGLEP